MLYYMCMYIYMYNIYVISDGCKSNRPMKYMDNLPTHLLPLKVSCWNRVQTITLTHLVVLTPLQSAVGANMKDQTWEIHWTFKSTFKIFIIVWNTYGLTFKTSCLHLGLFFPPLAELTIVESFIYLGPVLAGPICSFILRGQWLGTYT